MAALLIKTCLRQSITKKLLTETFTGKIKLRPRVVLADLTCLQCCCYHTTPALLAKKKISPAEKRRMEQEKLLAKLNPKIKPDRPSVEVWKNMTVKELATSAGRPLDDILDALHITNKNFPFKRDTILEDPSIIHETVKKLGAKVRVVTRPSDKKEEAKDEDLDAVKRPPPDPSVLIKRRPVITIMGHVDHGKTTLLDALRHSSVVDTEFGGITQHIGAFNVTLSSGEKMTFLDTPGHAAFGAMRARGANATDIVILVVAADDGVMEQTIQSINMAKDAKVPIIVAVNKCDKPNVDISRTHAMLAEEGIIVEELGGDVQSINISALKRTNLDQLIDAVAAQAEIMALKGDPTGLVEGVIIEATNDLHRGKLATALIQRGTLRKGDILVSGLAHAKVRAMFDHSGTVVTEAGISDAVQIIGWRELPIAGEEILEVENEKRANQVMKFRNAKLNEQKSIEHKVAAEEKHKIHRVEYEKLQAQKRALGVRRWRKKGNREKEMVEDTFPRVSIIVKGDVVGSVEAILDVLDTYTEEDKCKLALVHYGVGAISESDLDLAKAFNAIIYCFNTKVPKSLNMAIEKENISIRHHNVIYRLIDDLKLEINKKLPIIQTDETIGEAEVLKEFEINEKRKKIKVAGCRCIKGQLKKSELFKIIRDGEVIFRGKADSIRHLKNEIDTVKTNMECGVKLAKVDFEIKPGDKLVCYEVVDKNQETDWDPGF
ncbi:translation initiation factor IF-2, mitochondrial [Trichogramma pretiosum]|uniref:translation initiation factor IF-2, mitochondrial n=1 Tax=Trichogramma pretiosum TaxID=7493 RepID=UPI0006C9AF1D|nr:translation initiation factor IF-2, mitochondrial [Trichogramma pretiosum]